MFHHLHVPQSGVVHIDTLSGSFSTFEVQCLLQCIAIQTIAMQIVNMSCAGAIFSRTWLGDNRCRGVRNTDAQDMAIIDLFYGLISRQLPALPESSHHERPVDVSKTLS